MNHSMRMAVSTPTHNLILYRRPLHPELFVMKGRKTITAPAGIELETWLLPMGHMLRLTKGGHCLCELVTDRDNGLPTQGVITTFPAVGEREFEQLFEEAEVLYTTSAQTENLSPRLYQATLNDMRALAKDTGAMIAEWPMEATPGGRGTYWASGDVLAAGTGAAGEAGGGSGISRRKNAEQRSGQVSQGSGLHAAGLQGSGIQGSGSGPMGCDATSAGTTGGSQAGSLGTCLSMLEVQRFEDELHASSTHMHPGGGLVLRTQTVFTRV